MSKQVRRSSDVPPLAPCRTQECYTFPLCADSSCRVVSQQFYVIVAEGPLNGCKPRTTNTPDHTKWHFE